MVVGASVAGLRACEALRTDGYAGPVTLVGAEVHLPYDRPPLSKKLLAGDWEADRVALRKPDEYDTLGDDWFEQAIAGTSSPCMATWLHCAACATAPPAAPPSPRPPRRLRILPTG